MNYPALFRRFAPAIQLNRGSGRISTAIAVQQPLITDELMSLDVGEALIQSRSGWWLGKLEELRTPTTEDSRQLTLESGDDVETSSTRRFRRLARRLNNDNP